MKLVDMKNTPAERKLEATPSVQPKGPEYPWGLRLTLNNESLKKLGLTDNPKMGTVLHVDAVVEVCSVSSYEADSPKGESRSVDLQVTSMAIASADDDGAADKLYAGKK